MKIEDEFGRWVRGTRRPVAALLALLLVGGLLPTHASDRPTPSTEASSPPRHAYFSNEGSLYRIDAELPRALSALRAVPGLVSATVERATFAGQQAGPGQFVFRPEGVLASFASIGDDALSAWTGASSGSPFWSEVLRVVFRSDARELTTTYTVSEDEVTVVVPWDPEDPAGRVLLRIDGREVELSVRDLAADEVPVEARTALDEALGRLHDPAGFANAVAGFSGALPATLGETGYDPDSKWACLACAAVIATYGLSLAALVAACGGPFSAACVAAFLKLTISKVAVLSACSQCVDWIVEEGEKSKKKKEKKDKGGVSGGGCPCQGQPACSCS